MSRDQVYVGHQQQEMAICTRHSLLARPLGVTTWRAPCSDLVMSLASTSCGEILIAVPLVAV